MNCVNLVGLVNTVTKGAATIAMSLTTVTKVTGPVKGVVLTDGRPTVVIKVKQNRH